MNAILEACSPSDGFTTRPAEGPLAHMIRSTSMEDTTLGCSGWYERRSSILRGSAPEANMTAPTFKVAFSSFMSKSMAPATHALMQGLLHLPLVSWRHSPGSIRATRGTAWANGTEHALRLESPTLNSSAIRPARTQASLQAPQPVQS